MVKVSVSGIVSQVEPGGAQIPPPPRAVGTTKRTSLNSPIDKVFLKPGAAASVCYPSSFGRLLSWMCMLLVGWGWPDQMPAAA